MTVVTAVIELAVLASAWLLTTSAHQASGSAASDKLAAPPTATNDALRWMGLPVAVLAGLEIG